MKSQVVDANFPRTLDQRVYHLGLRPGEVANRIITLGSPSRAHAVASHLDDAPVPFTLTSERGFTTITGRYRGVPVSIVSIGMGFPNADFFVREVRECLAGDMLVVRLGSCGALVDVPVGSVVVPKGSIAVSRNYDFDFVSGCTSSEPPYRVSKPVRADPELHRAVADALKATRPEDIKTPIVDYTLNASADSFYASQGRQTSFPDHNKDLITHLMAGHKDLGTLEMETFHILHLAACWDVQAARAEDRDAAASVPPPHHTATAPSIAPTHAPSAQTAVPDNINISINVGVDSAGSSTTTSATGTGATLKPPRIRAAAAQMVFASRVSQEFIGPREVMAVEAWAGRAVLDALVGVVIEPDRLHEEAGSVWELKVQT